MDATDLPTVVYGVDPLCGWCFAIGDALAQARRVLDGEVRWEVALGGLVVGERVRPVREDEAYLHAGFQAVEQASGRRPSAAYWRGVVEPGTWVSDSEPAVRAVVAARDLAGDVVAVTVACLLSDGLYLDGRVPDDPEQVERVGEASGVGGARLLQRWGSPEGRAAVQTEYARARALGVTTYPSLFVRPATALPGAGALVPVLAGYAPAGAIVSAVRRAVGTALVGDRPRW